MAHTQADYSTKYREANVYGNIDNAELAARINPISLMDRAGHVIWYDNFEADNKKWYTDPQGTGAEAVISAGRSHFGNHAMKLVAGSDGLKYAAMFKRLDWLPSGKIGMEYFFNIDAESDTMLFRLEIYNGTRHLRANCIIDFDLDKITITTEDIGSKTIVTGADFFIGERRFHYIKMVVDPTTAMYDRMIFQGTTYDISAYTIDDVGASGKWYIRPNIHHYGDAGENAVCYIDNVVITMDEP